MVGGSILFKLDSFLSSHALWIRLVIYLSILLVFVWLSIWRRWLKPSGVVAAFIVGSAVFLLGGFSSFSFLLFFFVLGSLLLRLKKRDIAELESNGGSRDAFQVLSNSVAAVIFLFVAYFTNYRGAALIAYASAFSEELSDTFSSSFGPLSKEDTRSIITFTKVPRGISGGVTALGTLCGFIGSLLIATLYIGIYTLSLSHFLIVLFAGFFGSVIDSLLGATVQAVYRRKDGAITEKKMDGDEKNERIRGIPIVNNDMVNFISSLFSSLVAFGIGMLVTR